MDRATALRILGLGEARAPSDAAAQGAYWRLRAHLERRRDQASSATERAERRAELAALEQALGAASAAPPPSAVEIRPPAEIRPPRSRPAPRWLVAWAAAATLAALLLGWAALNRPATSAIPGSSPGGVASIAPAGAEPGASDGGAEPAAQGTPAAGSVESGQPMPEADGDGASPPAEAASAVTGAVMGSAGAGGPPADPAKLVMAANLEGSRLVIVRSADGAQIAEGPADESVYALAPGRYVLQVANPECADLWVSEVVLEPGEERRVEARNCERNGWIVVRSNVSGDRVAIDARAAGSSGPQKHAVSVGEHRVLVQKDGYVPWEGVVRIKSAELVTLRAQLYEEAAAAPADTSESVEELAQKRRQERQNAEWHDQIERWLLGRYDRNLSGSLDTAAEVSAIECQDWLDIEGAYDQASLRLPLTRAYGFDGSTWIEGALGVDLGVRDVAYERMKECGLR